MGKVYLASVPADVGAGESWRLARWLLRSVARWRLGGSRRFPKLGSLLFAFGLEVPVDDDDRQGG